MFRQTVLRTRLVKPNTSIETLLVSEIERKRGKLKPESIQVGLQRFHKHGLVILENAIGTSAIRHVRERMLQDIPRNLAYPNAHFNHGRSLRNMTQTPPLQAAYMYEEIWANRFAISLIEQIIGARPQLSYATSNIALPGGQGRQAVHSDYYCEHFNFPVHLEACIFLNDISPLNGSTEYWLGSHNGYNKKDHLYPDMGWIKREVFTERARICPPIQPSLPEGSICIRDLRLWHAGMANRSSDPRIMLGFIYNPRWFGSRMRLRLPANAREVIQPWDHIDCFSCCEFIVDDMDYLKFRQHLNLKRETQVSDPEAATRRGSLTPGPKNYWSEHE